MTGEPHAPYILSPPRIYRSEQNCHPGTPSTLPSNSPHPDTISINILVKLRHASTSKHRIKVMPILKHLHQTMSDIKHLGSTQSSSRKPFLIALAIHGILEAQTQEVPLCNANAFRVLPLALGTTFGVQVGLEIGVDPAWSS